MHNLYKKQSKRLLRGGIYKTIVGKEKLYSMKDFFTTYQSEIIAAIISFVVALFTSLLTHFLGYFKLRYTEKLKITSELSKKKYEGITKIREEISVLSQYENLCITEAEDSLIPELIGQKVYSPACCYSYETLLDIAHTLNDLYGKYGCYLRHSSILHLTYIKNFLLEYALACKRHRLSDEELRWASVPLYRGIRKWYQNFDKELICSMNKPSMKYFAHSGLIYNFLLKLYGLHFKQTKPYRYLSNKKSLLNQKIFKGKKLVEQNEEILV